MYMFMLQRKCISQYCYSTHVGVESGLRYGSESSKTEVTRNAEALASVSPKLKSQNRTQIFNKRTH
mgnify:FL=1